MGKDKAAAHKGARAGTSRVKALQLELVELESDLERARRRRDKAQARLEALEAIAEQTRAALATAEAADDARVARRDAAAAAAAAASAPVAPAEGAVDGGTKAAPRKGRKPKSIPDQVADALDGLESDSDPG